MCRVRGLLLLHQTGMFDEEGTEAQRHKVRIKRGREMRRERV